jgi:hypothetical protein
MHACDPTRRRGLKSGLGALLAMGALPQFVHAGFARTIHDCAGRRLACVYHTRFTTTSRDARASRHHACIGAKSARRAMGTRDAVRATGHILEWIASRTSSTTRRTTLVCESRQLFASRSGDCVVRSVVGSAADRQPARLSRAKIFAELHQNFGNVFRNPNFSMLYSCAWNGFD